MLPGVILLIVSSLVFLLSLTRFSGDDDCDNEQKPVALVVSSALRVAFYAWGAYKKEWPPNDAEFLVLFAISFDIMSCVVMSLQSRKRAITIGLLSFAAATLGCFAMDETDIASCGAVGLSLLLMLQSSRDERDENFAWHRAIFLKLLFCGRVLATRRSFVASVAIDCVAIFTACLSIFLDMISEDDT